MKLDEISKRVSLVASGDVDKFRIKTFIDHGGCPTLADEQKNMQGEVVACNNVTRDHPGITVQIQIKVKDKVELESSKEYTINFNLPGSF